jgi:DNA polymerase-3 subunit chi
MKTCYFIDTPDKNKYIFSIVEQLYKDKVNVIIYTESKERAEEIDRIIWVTKQESFIPHKIFKYEEKEALEPVAIIYEEINPIDAEILIMDTPCSINFASKFKTIYDFVDKSSDETLKKSRERYAKFKDMKYNMHYIK